MSTVKLTNMRLTRKSRTGRERPVLFIPELHVDHGEVVGIFGPNHVGKSTLLQYLGGATEFLDKNSLGGIEYPADNSSLIAFVPQDYAASILPWFGLSKNLYAFCDAAGIPESCSKANLTELLEVFDEQELITLFRKYGFASQNREKGANQLSGGQMQILAILRALVTKPTILLMDEPFSAIDVFLGAEFREKVFEIISKFETTTIIASHALGELISFADRIVFLKSTNEGGALSGIEARESWQDECSQTTIKRLSAKYELF